MGPLRSLGEKLLLTKTEDIRPIGFEDFVASLQNIRPSVNKEGLQQFENWANEYGERGGWVLDTLQQLVYQEEMKTSIMSNV